MFKRTVGQLLHTPKMTDSDHQLAHLSKSVIHFACISSTNIEQLLNSVCQLMETSPVHLPTLTSCRSSEPLQLASLTKDRTSLPVLLFDPLAKQVNQHPMPRISFRLQGGVVFTQGYDVATTNHPAVISPTQHSPRLISLQTLTSV